MITETRLAQLNNHSHKSKAFGSSLFKCSIQLTLLARGAPEKNAAWPL